MEGRTELVGHSTATAKTTAGCVRFELWLRPRSADAKAMADRQERGPPFLNFIFKVERAVPSAL